ncbi:hypothetical protein G6F62_006970 [Rhizopus arrhizus]|nr:hypothetical protein G6F62_006970 [Rhizopus arrhizus]
MNDHLISARTDFIDEKDTENDPWIFKDINISHLFNKYQTAINDILIKLKTLPVESYMHELASLTYIFFLCKNQHNEIAEMIFSLDLLKDMTISLESKTIDHDLDFSMDYFMTINAAITNLALAKTTREQAIRDFSVLASQMSYGQRRLLVGIINL